VPHTETPVYVSEQPTEDELHPVTKEDFESDPEIQEFFRKGKEVARALDNGEPLPYSFAEDINEPDYPEHVIDTETDLDRWNKMIEEAEKEVAKAVEQDSLQDRVARGESYIDQTGEEIPLDDTPDMERPGDYITPPEEAESKKKTYMSKDQEGRPYTKTRE
jgi:hypothetical protein